MIIKWRCIKCGYLWRGKLKERPQRCAAGCGSYWIVKDEKYRQILGNIKTRINKFASSDNKLIVIAEVLRDEGVTSQPLKTLQTLQRLLEDAQRFKKTRRYVCLSCGYCWESQIVPSRCAALCGGSYILPEERYKELMRKLKHLVREAPLLLNRIIALEAILKEFGITGKPIQTLNLLEKILKRAQQLKKEG